MLEASSNRKKGDVTCKKWARERMVMKTRYVVRGTVTEDCVGRGTKFEFY